MIHAFSLATTLFMRWAFGRVYSPLNRLGPVLAHPSLIWVVDDEPDDFYSLREASPAVIRAGIIDASVDDRWSDVLPRLILLDLNMQYQSGLDTLQGLRATIAFYRLPVTILTTSDAHLQRDMSSRVDAGSFLIQPIKQANAVLMLQDLALDRQLRIDY
ncbi:response regulator [Fibrella forsythiae]|uniref:Response regulator n=1 Tax=Fibrella forsythiae TaxID=2817061 RepID=A0ABS3JSF5_9BACT|nr:response regulator [Fibrella forsythiae]MBO0952953.1 response regulator [Fibrella forsythiae]